MAKGPRNEEIVSFSFCTAVTSVEPRPWYRTVTASYPFISDSSRQKYKDAAKLPCDTSSSPRKRKSNRNKGLSFPYPKGNMASELTLLTFTTVVESVRLFLGKKGNLTEQSTTVLLSMLLTVPSALSSFYFLLWQTYVLRLDMRLRSKPNLRMCPLERSAVPPPRYSGKIDIWVLQGAPGLVFPCSKLHFRSSVREDKNTM
ncbi:uncharacterized protein LOC135400655 [Ornithodoros turicata]|uniref:uncharacterized protein LOC135400655 n=1 Tax=Ornithodoros turicata TaxID=34597 RepID=UPI003139D3B3